MRSSSKKRNSYLLTSAAVELSPGEEAEKRKRKEDRDAAKAKANTRIVVAIDFGTTHTGNYLRLSMKQSVDK